MTPELAYRITARDESAATLRQVEAAARRAGQTISRETAATAPAFKTASANVGNLAAQFNDIGVQLAGGQSPFLIAIQQGSQISQVLGPMGAKGAVASLGTAFMSLLSPVNLLTIGAIAAGGALIQWLAGMGGAADETSKKLAEQAAPLSAVRGKISELEDITTRYAEAIRGTAKDQSIATDSIVASSAREFAAKKSLLELEMQRQEAAISLQKAQLADLSSQLQKQITAATPNVINNVAGGYSDPLVGQFVRSPAQDAALQKTLDLIANSPLTDQIKELRANIDLAEISTTTLAEALGTTFEEGVKIAEGHFGTKAAKELKPLDLGMKDTIKQAESLAETVSNSLATAFTGLFTTLRKGGNVIDYLSNQLGSLADQIMGLALQSFIKSMLGGGGGSFFNTSATGGSYAEIWAKNLASGLSPDIALASGGVMAAPGLSAYSGTVVSKPTIFPFASGVGLMGEAGAEAILPLKRGSDGKLGVSAGSSGGAGGEISVSVQVSVVNGNIVPLVTEISGRVAGQKIRAEAPAAVAAAQRNRSLRG